MPRKQKIVVEENDTKKNKKNLMNTIVKTVKNKDEHIILQLPLSQQRVNNLINLERENYDTINEPLPYEPNCCYLNDDFNKVTNYNNNDIELNNNNHSKISCFWCCHPVDITLYGMPINYNSINDTYTIYGSFCSLQCANAYNFSVHCGSDKVWEINSMIQMLGKKYGITSFIRPAPSRYLLKMFNGNMDIEEFRKIHHTNDSTHVLNLPPMISISSGYEVINTSYLHKK